MTTPKYLSMTTLKPTIEIHDLKTGYKHNNEEIIVSSNINDNLYGGELTCLLGPNGAGKSTILKTLSAFIPPLAGEININGKVLQDFTASELAKCIGVVLTDKLSVTNMKVEELVGTGRSPFTGFWGKLSDKDHEIIDESLSLVGISNLRNRLVSTLSDGERQKAMIAKSLAQQTPIIFLDEPTAFLDYPSKASTMILLKRLARLKNTTIFLSTHDLDLALQIADKIWLIDKKYGIKTGTPEDLALSGDLEKYFEGEGLKFDIKSGIFKVESPEMNKICLAGGNEVKRNMVAKAFSRNGYKIIEEPRFETINIHEDGYEYDGKKVKTIQELLEIVIAK